ncbi:MULTISPECIES: ABC transporter ATP-binding protein [Paenibacillus]|uniref:ABC transporter related protein n=2 Tax=Paenibacillus lactis TaxID=228574 RepID=G4HNA7_9BACL|nr:ABC transporter ATP-binding protein [Paenibacillus lactis]EHB54269.1 ABC transporter related protein [Paenibacillus lactis 154]MBP1896259.1 ABC-2 type transport system ATP-binding protein [Paenibacillus lactis]MCM3497136.1 ABC transporter ATP-binding protein [Paenibacillus lactis]HAF96994.1 ABC transporter ATP-binding protein [Paenibacillus lactis]
MENLLQARNISKVYGGGRKALHDVSLSIGSGKIIGLLGTNGSGKSTFMKIAAGLMQPSKGSMEIAGMPVGLETKAEVSFMPDRPLTEGWMKVSDAIEYFRDFFADFDPDKARSMLEFMMLNPEDRVSTLSKGMNERLQLTLALSRNAKLYMLDEPIGGVDPVARGKILDAIVKFYNEDSSIIISTHLVSDIERIFDEVIFIRDGEIAMHDEVENIRIKHGKSIDEMFKEVYA